MGEDLQRIDECQPKKERKRERERASVLHHSEVIENEWTSNQRKRCKCNVYKLHFCRSLRLWIKRWVLTGSKGVVGFENALRICASLAASLAVFTFCSPSSSLHGPGTILVATIERGSLHEGSAGWASALQALQLIQDCKTVNGRFLLLYNPGSNHGQGTCFLEEQFSSTNRG